MLLSRRHTRRFYTPITSEFRRWLMRAHLAIFYADRGDLPLKFCPQAPSIVAVRNFEKSCDKYRPTWLVDSSGDSPRIGVKTRRNGHTRRMSANLIADIWHARYCRYYTPIAAIGENRNRCTGHTRRGDRRIKRDMHTPRSSFLLTGIEPKQIELQTCSVSSIPFMEAVVKTKAKGGLVLNLDGTVRASLHDPGLLFTPGLITTAGNPFVVKCL